MCRRLDLFGRELLAVDGTRIKAVNNKDRNFTTGSLQKFIEAADKKLEDYLKRLDAGDAEECATSGSRVKNLAEKIEALKKKRGECPASARRCHIVERRTREFCVPNIFKRPRLPRATCS